MLGPIVICVVILSAYTSLIVFYVVANVIIGIVDAFAFSFFLAGAKLFDVNGYAIIDICYKVDYCNYFCFSSSLTLFDEAMGDAYFHYISNYCKFCKAVYVTFYIYSICTGKVLFASFNTK